MRRYEPEDPLEPPGVVGVGFGREAGLGEAQPGEPQQRVVPIDALVE